MFRRHTHKRQLLHRQYKGYITFGNQIHERSETNHQHIGKTYPVVVSEQITERQGVAIHGHPGRIAFAYAVTVVSQVCLRLNGQSSP